MKKADFQILYEYNRWANAQVLEAASRLSSEQFAKDLSNSFRSIRDTLTHILSAEWIWLTRWQGISPTAMLNPEEFPNVEALKTRWSEIEDGQTRVIQQLTDESLAKELGYTNTKGEHWKYPLGQMMQHVVNHSTYHRGQVTTMLRQLGAAPKPTDFLLFLDVKSRVG